MESGSTADSFSTGAGSAADNAYDSSFAAGSYATASGYTAAAGNWGPGTFSTGTGSTAGYRPPNNAPASLTYPEMPCYTFNEEASVFVFWGRNTELRLLSQAQMGPARR